MAKVENGFSVVYPRINIVSYTYIYNLYQQQLPNSVKRKTNRQQVYNIKVGTQEYLIFNLVIYSYNPTNVVMKNKKINR